MPNLNLPIIHHFDRHLYIPHGSNLSGGASSATYFNSRFRACKRAALRSHTPTLPVQALRIATISSSVNRTGITLRRGFGVRFMTSSYTYTGQSQPVVYVYG